MGSGKRIDVRESANQQRCNLFCRTQIDLLEEQVPAYNFEVRTHHNYFVGLLGWLVHNKYEAKYQDKIELLKADEIVPLPEGLESTLSQRLPSLKSANGKWYTTEITNVADRVNEIFVITDSKIIADIDALVKTDDLLLKQLISGYAPKTVNGNIILLW